MGTSTQGDGAWSDGYVSGLSGNNANPYEGRWDGAADGQSSQARDSQSTGSERDVGGDVGAGDGGVLRTTRGINRHGNEYRGATFDDGTHEYQYDNETGAYTTNIVMAPRTTAPPVDSKSITTGLPSQANPPGAKRAIKERLYYKKHERR